MHPLLYMCPDNQKYVQCLPVPDLLGLLATEGALVGLDDTGGGACFVVMILDALARGGELNDGKL